MIKDQKMVSLFGDIGMEMIRRGAEIARVEDTVTRMGYAYGAARMDVFTITSLLIVTMTMPDSNEYTTTRNFEAGSNDFHCVEQLNALSRSFCSSPFDETELRDRLHDILRNEQHIIKSYAGSALGCFMFSIFYGGGVIDGIFGALCGIFVCFLQTHLRKLCSSSLFFYFLASVLTGFVICTSSLLIPIRPQVVMISVIMLLIPGLAITNAVKDVFLGDTLSGIMRMTEALFFAAGIALGFIIPVFVIGV